MNLTDLRSQFKYLFKSEDSRFVLACGFKFALIFILTLLIVSYITWVILSLNHLYFETLGFDFSPEVRDAFFDKLLGAVYEGANSIFASIVLIFFLGVYVGKILLRPFSKISEYAVAVTNGEKAVYSPDLFSDYRLLTRFSEHFFVFMTKCLVEKEIKPQTIAPQYTKIRSPEFEKVFFVHFLLFVAIISTVSCLFMSYAGMEAHQKLIELFIETIQTQNKSSFRFLHNQVEVAKSVIYFGVLFISVSYFVLSFHLYGKVSGAIFGIFATMRAFMKGNTKARVHLVGYTQVRPYTRNLNKYLDMVERECEKSKNKVKSP